MSASIALSPDFAWCVLVVAASAIQVTAFGTQAARLRTRLNVPYPDMGSGRHAAKLSDKDWDTFNNYQRAHQHYLEQLSNFHALVLVGGLFQPRASGVLGAIYLVGRQLYGTAYQTGGSKAIRPGAALSYVGLIGLCGVSIVGSLQTLGFL